MTHRGGKEASVSSKGIGEDESNVPFKRKKVRIYEIMSGGFAVKIQQCVKNVRRFLVTFSLC